MTHGKSRGRLGKHTYGKTGADPGISAGAPMCFGRGLCLHVTVTNQKPGDGQGVAVSL